MMSSVSPSQKESNEVYEETGKLEAKQAFGDFIASTSVHGIGRIFDKKNGFIRRCLWGVCSLTAIVALLVMLFYSWKEISSLPVKTVSSIKLKPLQFPSITICNMNTMDTTKLSESKARDINQALILMFSKDSNQTTNASVSVYNELADDMMEETKTAKNEFFRRCFYGDVSPEEKRYLNCSDIFKSFRLSFDRCFVLNQTNLSLATRRTQLELTIFVNRPGYLSIQDEVGVKYAVHAPGVVVDMSRLHHVASVGYVTNVALRVTEHNYLPAPYTAFGDAQCADTGTEDFRRRMDGDPELYPKSRGQVYSLDACMIYRAYAKAAAVCNCTMKFIGAPYPLCTLRKMTCLGPAHNKIMQDALNNGDLLGCPRPCRFVTYTQTISSAYLDPSSSFAEAYGLNQSEIRMNFLKLNFYFDDLLVQELRHVAEYDNSTIMGLLGGNMGFFIGASVLTFVEVLEVVVFFIVWSFKLILRRCFRFRCFLRQSSEE